MLVRGGDRRVARFREVDGRELEVEVLGQGLGGEQVRLAAPLEVRHQVGLGPGRPERRTERELVGEREREVVDPDRVEVDVGPGELGVALVELGEVAVADDRVAHPPPGQVHHRVAEVTELEIEDGEHPAAGVMELPGVPHHRRLAAPADAAGSGGASPGENSVKGSGSRLRAPVDVLVAGHADRGPTPPGSQPG